LTTLTLSSDQLEFVGINPELLKARLKIAALDTGFRIVLEARIDGQLLFRTTQLRGNEGRLEAP